MTVERVTSELAPSNLNGYDLIVAGGPPCAFSMTRPSTRHWAVEKNGAPQAPERGIREQRASLNAVSRPLRAAAFDTRADSPRLPGSAAKAVRNELRSLGFYVSTPAKSFHVHGYEGPLIDGELGRVASWARGSAAPQPTSSRNRMGVSGATLRLEHSSRHAPAPAVPVASQSSRTTSAAVLPGRQPFCDWCRNRPVAEQRRRNRHDKGAPPK